MDKIKISDLEVFCNHGVHPEENKLGQKFIVSLMLYFDARDAGMTDDLTRSIDYSRVIHDVNMFMKDNTYNLIEAVAEEWRFIFWGKSIYWRRSILR